MEQIAAGTDKGATQDSSLVTKAPKLTKEHGVVDWSRQARDVVNHIRAMQPWPTAYTFFRRTGQAPIRLIFYKAKVHEGTESGADPGQVILPAAVSGGLFVATGQGGQIEVLELQPAGKRRMSSAEFLRGHRPQPGDSFGPEPG